jgi:hypothetical protein
MPAYRAIWSTVAGVAVLTGVVLALATAPMFISILLFVAVGTCAGTLSGNLRLLESNTPAAPGSFARTVVTEAVIAGAAGLACYGFGSAAGVALVAVMTGLAITSPWTILLVRGRLGSPTTEGRSRSATERIDRPLTSWSDSELYSVWCATDNEVLRATKSDRTATAARARDHLLAEIERRYPTQTAAWLTSHAALNGAPPRFLLTAEGP